MRRRLVLFIAVVVAGIAAVVVLLPFWLGAAAGAAGRSRGLTFREYERIGYGRFALHDVEVRRPGVRVTISRIETETPLLWLWHHARRQPAPVVAGKWHVEVEKRASPPKPNPDRGWMQLRALLQKIAGQLEKWLPVATTGPGLVRWPTGEVSIEAAKWAQQELAVKRLVFRGITADATLAFRNAADELQLAVKSVDATSSAHVLSRGAALTGDVALWEQPAKLSATFAPRGWLPAEASLQAENWRVPGERVKLGQLYALLHASAKIEWRAERIVADVTARGEPLQGKPAPPLEIVVRGNGDAAAFTIQSLQATVPGIEARLSEPVTIERSGKIRESAARFSLQMNLAQQPWFAARGSVNGEARLVSGISASPVVEFSLEARDISARDVALAEFGAKGKLEWPRVRIETGTLVASGGERLQWQGGWDIRAKELLPSTIEGEIRRASLARWLPKEPEFEVIALRAEAAGKLPEIQHNGRVASPALKVKGVNPFAVSAEWRGRGRAIENFEARATAGNSSLRVGGNSGAESLQLTVLHFTQGDATLLELKEPATIRWRPQLQIGSLQLTGPSGSLAASATLGEQGKIEISARGITSRWLSDFLPAQGPAWQLNLIALIGSWNRGPAVFSLSGAAGLELGAERSAAVMFAARGDQEGVRVEAVRATEGDATVVNATGRLPVTFTPGAKPLMKIDADGALAVDATVAPNAAFWQKLAALSGVELQEPRASAQLSGTWQRPRGRASLQAERISILPSRTKRPLPTIESLDVKLTGDSSGVILDTFSVRVEGQAVRASGRLPVPDGKWTELFKEPLAAARRGADLRLEIPDAEVAVFTRFLPAVLAPKGRLQADLHYKSGGLEGFLKLRDAASRPLGPLGVLQEINADIALAGRKFALRGVTARSGGQPITLSGTVELPENAGPRYDLALRGENLPFVRQTGVLLRGDLDLKLQTPATANGAAANPPPRLSGTVRLRDSLFLADVRAFLPKGGGASPTRRPPYFAIETPPVNAWTLAIDVVGEEFMRLRTPVFTGVASARFRLGGTLGEPRAIGEIAIEEGSVRMPFASFEVMQGSVRLTEADPHEPTIYLRATGRRYGYDLTMEIEGKASAPEILFTSSPALESEQVLLMVMTGAAPSDEFARSNTKRAQGIGQYLGRSLLSNLWGDARDADRLSIVSGENISREGKETYDIEYKLTDRWTVTAQTPNEYDEYTIGMKWRIFRGEREEKRDEKAAKPAHAQK